MDLYILRHGDAATPLKDEYRDEERSLTIAGCASIRTAARWLKISGSSFEIIASSPLKRALETAEIVSVELRNEKIIEIWDELLPGKSRDALLYRLDTMNAVRSLLLVGHEPCLSSLIGRIAARNEDALIVLRKGGMAKLRNVTFRPRVTGELQWLLEPGHIQLMSGQDNQADRR